MNPDVKLILHKAISCMGVIIPDIWLKQLQDRIIYDPVIKRKKLGADPIPLFETVLFELRSRCNNTCSFCPANINYDERDDIVMPFELFNKAVLQLNELGFAGRVCFYINNEPLIVPNIAEYVSIAVKNLPKARKFQILTNGLALSRAIGEKLLKSGVNSVIINWYHEDLESPLPQRILDFQAMAQEFNKNGKNRVTVQVDRRRINDILTNRANFAPNKKGINNHSHKGGFCTYPFTHLCINPEGKVMLCCMDVYYRNVIGSISTDKIVDIWYGREFQQIRQHLLNGDREPLLLCNKCDHIGVQPGHMKTVAKKIIRELSGCS